MGSQDLELCHPSEAFGSPSKPSKLQTRSFGGQMRRGCEVEFSQKGSVKPKTRRWHGQRDQNSSGSGLEPDLAMRT